MAGFTLHMVGGEAFRFRDDKRTIRFRREQVL